MTRIGIMPRAALVDAFVAGNIRSGAPIPPFGNKIQELAKHGRAYSLGDDLVFAHDSRPFHNTNILGVRGERAQFLRVLNSQSYLYHRDGTIDFYPSYSSGLLDRLVIQASFGITDTKTALYDGKSDTVVLGESDRLSNEEWRAVLLDWWQSGRLFAAPETFLTKTSQDDPTEIGDNGGSNAQQKNITAYLFSDQGEHNIAVIVKQLDRNGVYYDDVPHEEWINRADISVKVKIDGAWQKIDHTAVSMEYDTKAIWGSGSLVFWRVVINGPKSTIFLKIDRVDGKISDVASFDNETNQRDHSSPARRTADSLMEMGILNE